MISVNELLKFKAVIFDLDETLLYTKEANLHAYEEACTQNGFQLNKKIFEHAFDQGLSWAHFLPQSTGLACEDKMHKKIREDKKKIYQQKLNEYAKPNNELISLARRLKGKTKLALATTAEKENAESALKTFDLTKLFDVIVTGSDISEKKPSPEIYFKTISRLNVKPSQAIVFEDSNNGIKAAQAAGIQAIQVKKK